MAPIPDWNLKMVRSREARRLLPKVQGGSDAVAWSNIRVAHLDTGYTEHPAFGDWAGGAAWLRVTDGLNLREPGRGRRATPSTTRATPATARAPAASCVVRPCRLRAATVLRVRS